MIDRLFQHSPQVPRSGQEPVAKTGRAPRPENRSGNVTTQGSFDAALQKAIGSREIRFSRHAMDRMDRRNITLNPDEMARLKGAIDRAEKSGMKESLVILDRNALIVSVPNRTVITAMDRSLMRDNLVTHIDSAVLL